MVYRKYDRALDEALHKGSPRQKALLVSNSRADRNVLGTSPLTKLERLKIRDSVSAGADSIRYNEIIDARVRLEAHLGNVQTRYLQLRERCAMLSGLFALFKQNQYFADLLNELTWSAGAKKQGLHKLLSHAHICLGEVRREVEEGGSSIRIDVADTARETAIGLIAAITDQAMEVKAMVAAARDFMEERAVHLDAYRQYLDGIEGEIGDVIRDTKYSLYHYDTEGWEQLRSVLAEMSDDLLALMEALPDYGSLTADDAVYEESSALFHGR